MSGVSITVQNQNNLKTSLEEYIKFQELDGVICDDCKQKVKVKKRDLFGKLPKTLMFHLKRFEMDNNGNLTKLNSRFEFPLILDMAPYLKENNDLSEEKRGSKVEYRLTGIIMHLGTLQSGHYYSYIFYEKNWYEFNDSNVRKCDYKSEEDFIEKIFGPISGGQISNNAYMLYYDKIVDKVEPSSPASKIEKNEKIISNVSLINENTFECIGHIIHYGYIDVSLKDLVTFLFNAYLRKPTPKEQHCLFISKIKTIIENEIKNKDISYFYDLLSTYFTNDWLTNNFKTCPNTDIQQFMMDVFYILIDALNSNMNDLMKPNMMKLTEVLIDNFEPLLNNTIDSGKLIMIQLCKLGSLLMAHGHVVMTARDFFMKFLHYMKSVDGAVDEEQMLHYHRLLPDIKKIGNPVPIILKSKSDMFPHYDSDANIRNRSFQESNDDGEMGRGMSAFWARQTRPRFPGYGGDMEVPETGSSLLSTDMSHRGPFMGPFMGHMNGTASVSYIKMLADNRLYDLSVWTFFNAMLQHYPIDEKMNLEHLTLTVIYRYLNQGQHPVFIEILVRIIEKNKESRVKLCQLLVDFVKKNHSQLFYFVYAICIAIFDHTLTNLAIKKDLLDAMLEATLSQSNIDSCFAPLLRLWIFFYMKHYDIVKMYLTTERYLKLFIGSKDFFKHEPFRSAISCIRNQKKITEYDITIFVEFLDVMETIHQQKTFWEKRQNLKSQTMIQYEKNTYMIIGLFCNEERLITSNSNNTGTYLILDYNDPHISFDCYDVDFRN